MTKETKEPESKTYGGLFSLFYSPPATPQDQIFQDLKAEIESLAKIANRFDELYIFFNKTADGVIGDRDYSSATPEVKVAFSLTKGFARVFRDANVALYDLTSDLRDIFLSELSFDDKCTMAMATAEAAKKIFPSVAGLPLEVHPLGARMLNSSRALLDDAINNINSLGAQGQALSVKTEKAEPIKPFTGPSFSI